MVYGYSEILLLLEKQVLVFANTFVTLANLINWVRFSFTWVFLGRLGGVTPEIPNIHTIPKTGHYKTVG